MENTKNTIMRDKNGNIREGVKWVLEFNDILVRFFGNECGYSSKGFQNFVVNGKCCLGSVFELDIDKKPTPEFLDFISSYNSDHIKGITYRKEIKIYERTLYKNAVIVLL